MTHTKKLKKIVLSGAPSSGKSSVIQRLTNMNLKNTHILPETARILLTAGFPIPKNESHVFDFQKANLSLQKTLEYSVQQNHSPETTHIILDRGSIDGAAFWPNGMDHFFKTFYIDYEFELSRYDHVIFTRLPEKNSFGTNDTLRFHNFEESLEAEIKLQTLWSRHTSYTEIPAQANFQDKIQKATQTILNLIGQSSTKKISAG